MKYPPCKLGFLRGFLALSVSLAVIASSHAFALASFNNSVSYQPGDPPAQPAQPAQIESGDELLSASATVTETGVRLEWTSRSDTDNLGFNIYRLQDGQRIRINREIIPGSLFLVGANPVAAAIALRSHSHGWLDAGGTADSVYYIESVSVSSSSRFHRPITPAFENIPGKRHFPRLDQAQKSTAIAEPDSVDKSYREVGYPAGASAATAQQMLASTLEKQWEIAAQTAVKIAVRKQGWYRVTQSQLAAVGFNPTVDIRNLQLFVDGQEVAINTSQSSGPFGPSDYIEFFGSGIDVPSSDVRTYYLIAGAEPGKRVRGEMQVDSVPVSTPAPPAAPAPASDISPANRPAPKYPWPVWQWEIAAGHPAGVAFIPWIIFLPSASPKSDPPTTSTSTPLSSEPPASAGGPSNLALTDDPSAVFPASAKKTSKRNTKKKGKRKRVRPQTSKPKREYSHAVAAAVAGLTSFQYTVERKYRTVYFSSLLNGDAENWFGQVISNPGVPSTQTINTPNPALSAVGPARLEVKLQGVNHVSHQVSVKFNETVVGNFNFFGLASPVLTFDVPLSLLQNGANTLKFTPAFAGDVSLVDYVRITYPHTFRADSDTLKFSLLGTQTVQVDDFSSADVKVIEYSDPLNVSLIKPEPAANSIAGSAIVIPPSNPKSKTQRLLFATAAPPEQPAAISLNQPSTLNLNTNNADLLIVTTAGLRASLAPLLAAREAVMNVEVVDVEDVYDEFGYGLHGPQAVKTFLARAHTAWAGKPRYVIFAGDASYDPRGYTGAASLDFVPTKLVDASFNETASDDWLADFDGDGIADIPIGRLPVGTAAEADLVVSKIVNFTPVTPESAMLVADDPTGYYFNFEHANDQVQAQLPGSIAVQRVNVRTVGPAAARTNIIAGFNDGRALVNYTGHGNVDVWSGAAIFKAKDALDLLNGNKLSFVIVMDCLNGYFHAPALLSLSEAFLKAPQGGAVAAFASSGLTFPEGQHEMSMQLYSLIYGAQSIALGDAIKIAKGATTDIDVRRTWIFFGDPSMKIR